MGNLVSGAEFIFEAVSDKIYVLPLDISSILWAIINFTIEPLENINVGKNSALARFSSGRTIVLETIIYCTAILKVYERNILCANFS